MGSKSKKIVILHLAHWDQLLGGAELQLKYLSQYLVNQGYEVHFIYRHRTLKVPQKSNLRLYPLKHFKIPGTFGKTWFVSRKLIHKTLIKIQPDVIITRAFSSWAGIASKYALIHNLHHFHFVASDNEVKRQIGNVLRFKVFDKIEYKYFNEIFIGNTEIIVQNQEQKKLVEKKHKIKCVLLPQAAPKNDTSLIDKTYDKLKVVWIANFKPLKRPEKFLEIVQHFKNRNDITFSMLGGFSNTYYEDLLKPYYDIHNFQYLGKLTNSEVNKVLDTAHVLVNTSDYEGFSNTFIQAWLRQVVVLSLHSDPNSILTDKQLGFKTNNVYNANTKLECLMKEPNNLKMLGIRSREYALKHHVLNDEYYKKLEI